MSAIADIAFVCSKDQCPDGYEIISFCPSGHKANLWKKFVGAPAEERYLCYSTESKDDKIIEDMYIPGSGERYVIKGYEVVKRTIEGEDSLNCKYLAIKRTKRELAKTGISEIAVYRCKDKPPACYKKLGAKLNSLYICAKIEPIEDIKEAISTGPSSPAPPTPSQGHSPTASNTAQNSYHHTPSSPPPSLSPPAPSLSPPPPAPPKSQENQYTGNYNYPSNNQHPGNNRYPGNNSYQSGGNYPGNNFYPGQGGYTTGGYHQQNVAPPTGQYPPRVTPPTNQYSQYPPPGVTPPINQYPPRVTPPTNQYPPPRVTPPTNQYPPPGVTPPTNQYPPPGVTPPTNQYSPTAPPRASIDQSDLVLGFDHLDLDQPIEFDQKEEFEETPPDSPVSGSPVNEHVTIEETVDLMSSAPLESSAPFSQSSAPFSQSSTPFSQSSAPYSQSSAPYSQPSAPYSQPSVPAPYNPGYPSPYQSQYPPPMGQYPGPRPPAPYQSRPTYGGYQSYPQQHQGYPPAYNPRYNAPPTRPSGGGSSNIGFKF